MKNRTDKKVLLRVIGYIKRYIPLIIISIFMALISVAATLYIPIIVGKAIDNMVGVGNVTFDAVYSAIKKIIILIAVSSLAQWLLSVINNRITYHVVRDIRSDAFAKIQKMPVGYMDSHMTGDILSRIINDSEQFSDGLLMGFTQLFTGITTIIGTLVFMLRINYKIAFAVIILTPASLFIAKFIAGRTHRLFVRRASATGDATAYINEMISNRKVTAAFSYDERAESDFGKINDELEKATLGAVFYSSLVNPSTRFINSVIYAIVGLGGSVLAVGGSITVGDLSCFLSYAGQYAKPFNEISGVVTELQNALTCAGRLFALIDEPDEISDAENAIVMKDAKGNIRFENVSFSYVPEKRLLENIDIDVKAGQHVAIVGPTGCGKTTLINLLMRFYDVTGGRITLDGTDIRNITRHSLRASFGMVLQDTWLSGGTVLDNITMGKPDATMDEVVAAAKAAHAHGFISRMSDGYNTRIGQGGSLSQGERQLLCIARIMLAPPPMLILDEATSSIDTRTELKIQDAFAKLMQGRTSFIVAHRLSTIRNADMILVMKDGNIIEKGTHTELLERGGFYSVLYNSQFAGKESEQQ